MATVRVLLAGAIVGKINIYGFAGRAFLLFRKTTVAPLQTVFT